jgi:hypothetical protein
MIFSTQIKLFFTLALTVSISTTLFYSFKKPDIKVFAVENQTIVESKVFLDDQQLTIERGTKSSFKPYICSVADNNLQCKYRISDLPSFCKNDEPSRIITCNTDSQTPVISKFSILPSDSKGVSGTAGEFLVTVINPDSPGLAVEKKCFKKDTTTDCSDINLTQGDVLKYSLLLKATGNSPVTNIKVSEIYDKDNLFEISYITPASELQSEGNIIATTIGNLASGESKVISYTAKIKDVVVNGTRIINKSKITSENSPEQLAQTAFTTNIPGQLNLSTTYINCLKKDTNISCDHKELNPGDTITYKTFVKNTGTGVAYNVKSVNLFNKNNFGLISNINPSGFFDPGAGSISWSIGTLNGGETKELSFDAKISQDTKTGDIIINQVSTSSDGYPNQNISNSFVLLNSNSVVQESLAWWQKLVVGFFIIAALGWWYYLRANKIYW